MFGGATWDLLESSSKPVQRAALCVRDCKHQRMVGVDLERNKIREAFDDCLVNRHWGGRSARPDRERTGELSDSIEERRNLNDKLVTEPRTLLVVPERGGAKFGARIRVQLDAHDAP